jgi:hypothetical protein
MARKNQFFWFDETTDPPVCLPSTSLRGEEFIPFAANSSESGETGIAQPHFNKKLEPAAAKLCHDPVALRLARIPVDPVGRVTPCNQFVGQVVNHPFSIAENYA